MGAVIAILEKAAAEYLEAHPKVIEDLAVKLASYAVPAVISAIHKHLDKQAQASPVPAS